MVTQGELQVVLFQLTITITKNFVNENSYVDLNDGSNYKTMKTSYDFSQDYLKLDQRLS